MAPRDARPIASYKFYAIDADGCVIGAPYIILASNDDDARLQAMEYCQSFDMDCWQGSRHVGLIKRSNGRSELEDESTA